MATPEIIAEQAAKIIELIREDLPPKEFDTQLAAIPKLNHQALFSALKILRSDKLNYPNIDILNRVSIESRIGDVKERPVVKLEKNTQGMSESLVVKKGLHQSEEKSAKHDNKWQKKLGTPVDIEDQDLFDGKGENVCEYLGTNLANLTLPMDELSPKLRLLREGEEVFPISKYLPNFKTVQDLKLDAMRDKKPKNREFNLKDKEITGFGNMFATSFLTGDTDPNAGNIGLVNGKKMARIDFGKALSFNARLNPKLTEIDDNASEFSDTEGDINSSLDGTDEEYMSFDDGPILDFSTKKSVIDDDNSSVSSDEDDERSSTSSDDSDERSSVSSEDDIADYIYDQGEQTAEGYKQDLLTIESNGTYLYDKSMFESLDFAGEVAETAAKVNQADIEIVLNKTMSNLKEAYGDDFLSDPEISNCLKKRMDLPTDAELTEEIVKTKIITSMMGAKEQLHNLAVKEISAIFPTHPEEALSAYAQAREDKGINYNKFIEILKTKGVDFENADHFDDKQAKARGNIAFKAALATINISGVVKAVSSSPKTITADLSPATVQTKKLTTERQ